MLRSLRPHPRPLDTLDRLPSSPDVVPCWWCLPVSDEPVQSPLHSVEVGRAAIVVSLSDASVVRPHSKIKIATGFIEQQLHPERDEARGAPRIEVVLYREIHIDDAADNS